MVNRSGPPRARVLRLVVLLLFTAWLTGPEVEAAPNVLLVTIDALRADHCGCYGYHRETTPTLDRLAARGTVFEQVVAPLPRTTQALATLMTSRAPLSHGVLRLTDRLDDGMTSLADVFSVAGYATGAFVSHPMRILEQDRRSSNLGQGFETVYRGGGVVRRSEQWLADVQEPFFLWIHLFDPHWSYAPPLHTNRFVDADYDHRRYEELVRGSTKGAIIYRNDWAEEDVQHAVDLYDGEILAADLKLQQILENLGPDRMARTYVAVCADHGEGLGEHDYFFDHGEMLHEGVLLVPWVLAGPTTARFPRRFRPQITLMEIGPTLLELAALNVPRDFEGRSLAGQLRKGTLINLVWRSRPYDHIFGLSDISRFSENPNPFMGQDRGRHLMVRTDPWKLIVVPRKAGPDLELLYHLEQDPDETVDRSETEKERVRKLQQRLREYMARWGDPFGGRKGRKIDQEDLEALKTLGYVN